MRKDAQAVSFHADMDLAPFCDIKGSVPCTTLYGLMGVIVHQGGMRSGHYVAYVKHDQKWYYISGACVCEARRICVWVLTAVILLS